MNRHALILPGLALAAAAAIWLPGDADGAGRTAQAAAPAEAAARPDLVALAETLAARPIFDVSRRPPAAAETEAPAAEAAPRETRLSLVGILEDGAARIALVRSSASAELHRLGVGDALADWTVVGVDRRYIAVARDGGAPELLALGQ